MCGIAGLFGSFSHVRGDKAIQAMLAAQQHRGPDDRGAVVLPIGDNVVAVGSQRLAIQDVTPLGHQPMKNPDTGDLVVYNGEIYNAPELRDELASVGLTCASRSDTEVLLRAYQRWGRSCLDRFNGMFAFAVWDARQRRLLLARDHLGIKPLYYAQLQGRGLLFASEVSAILASDLLCPALDMRAVAGYLAYGAVQEPLTILEGVVALPRGSWLEVASMGRIVAKGKYWDFPPCEPRRRDDGSHDLIAEGRGLLDQAVRRHLLSDVPVGVFLSSGLDSTAVVGLASQAANEVHAFTVTFPDDPAYDEGPLARDAARKLGVVHHECAVTAATAAEWAGQAIEHMDQPTMDGVNTYIVARSVSERGLRVALSGQGGDEIFGGYRSFRGVPRWHRRISRLALLPTGIRTRLVRFRMIGADRVAREKAVDIVRTVRDVLSLYLQYRRLLSDRDLAELGVDGGALGLSGSYLMTETNTESLVVPNDQIASVSRLESAFYLGNTLLRDGDVFGMANSLEIRVPFLDKSLVEWAYRLPGDLLLAPQAPDKALLRQMCRQLYTPEQLGQKKKGFALPFSRWLLGPLRPLMEASLSDLKRTGLLRPAGIDRLTAEFLDEPNSAAWSRVWSLVVLGRWLTLH